MLNVSDQNTLFDICILTTLWRYINFVLLLLLFVTLLP